MKEGAVLAGKYRLLRPIGRGAMGEVWAAENQLTRRPFAVKLLAADFGGEDARRRLLREASAAGQLVHPNIVEVYDVGTDDEGDPFLVMQLLRGESLGQRLERERILSPADAATVGAQIARALEAAHLAGIIHRDLKPDNVFLHQEGDETIVKVLDFGVSKQTAAGATSSTVTGMAIGTPAYMSPEQARGRKVDPRSDLWALGVVLYEMLAGQRPFEGESAFDVVGQILHGTVPSLGDAVPNAPSELVEIVAGCLQREVASRTTSAATIAATLERLAHAADLATSPLLSDPPPRVATPDSTTMPALDAASSVLKNQSTRAVVTPRSALPAASATRRSGAMGIVAAALAVAVVIVVAAFALRTSDDSPQARSDAAAEGRPEPPVVTVSSPIAATPVDSGPPESAAPPTSATAASVASSVAVLARSGRPRPSASAAAAETPATSAAPKTTPTATSTVKFRDPG